MPVAGKVLGSVGEADKMETALSAVCGVAVSLGFGVHVGGN